MKNIYDPNAQWDRNGNQLRDVLPDVNDERHMQKRMPISVPDATINDIPMRNNGSSAPAAIHTSYMPTDALAPDLIQNTDLLPDFPNASGLLSPGNTDIGLDHELMVQKEGNDYTIALLTGNGEGQSFGSFDSEKAAQDYIDRQRKYQERIKELDGQVQMGIPG